MKVWQYFLLVLTLSVVSCSLYQKTTVVAPLEIPGATHVKMRMCAPCHRDSVESFAGSSHARITPKGIEKEGLGCSMSMSQTSS
jgi:hypothetical protein